MSARNITGCAWIDDTGAVVLSRKLVNDERPIRDLVAEIDGLADEASWTVDLTTVYAGAVVDGAG
jgi:hypothetical protein